MMRKPKIIFLVIDGLGDRPPKGVGGKTPLEAAQKPNLNLLVQEGLSGLVKPTYYQGNFPTSKDAHLSLFGYDLRKWQIGRGVFEALGVDWRLRPGEIAWRGNFATINPASRKIIDRRAGRIDGIKPLVRALNGLTAQGVKFKLKRGIDQRVVLVMSGRNLSEKVSDGDFHQTGIIAPMIKPLDKSKKALFTAQVMNEFLAQSHQILKNHPLNLKREKQGLLSANYILFREPGQMKKLPSFKQIWGWDACCIAGGDLYQGIGRALQMKTIMVKGVTGRADTDLAAKFKAARRAIIKYGFVYCHVKAVDNFSHDKDCRGKKEMIEKIDYYLPFLKSPQALLVITADHCTPCSLGEHTSDAVPVLVWGTKSDQVKEFSERACQKGGLGEVAGIDLLKKIIKISNV